MATTNSDGSIILSTKVDTSGVNQGMNSIKGSVGKIGGLLAAAFSVKVISNFAKESVNLYKIQMQNEVKLATVMRERVNATNDQIQAILDLTAAEQELGIIGDEVQIAGLQQLATFTKQSETLETLLPAMNNLIAQQYGYEASTGSAINVANLMGKVLQGQTGALTRVGVTFTEAQEEILKYGTESEKAATLAQVITDNVGEMNKALSNTDVGRQQQLSNTLGDIKEQFGEAINQIAIVYLPLLQSVANVLREIATISRVAASNLAKASGTQNNEKQWEKIAEDTDKTAENIEEQKENLEDLNKEMKKTLAGFDDAQILSAKTVENTESTEFDKITTMGYGGTNPDGSSYVDEVNETLGAIMGIVALSLAVVGLVLLMTGASIPYGIGFIIAGAGILGVTMAGLSGTDVGNDVIQMLLTIMAVASGALLAIGVILCFLLGPSPVTVGLIVAGGALLVGTVGALIGLNPDDIATWLSVIMGIAGGAMLALGIILCMVGSIPVGVGLIIAGAASLVSAVALNFDEVKNSITGWVAALMVIIGAASLVIGIILCVTGVGIPIGIALIVAGAVSLVTPIALNWDLIWSTIKDVFNSIIDWVKTYGLLVLGILLCLTGAGIPLGIALIIKWAKDGAENGVPLATAIVDKVKEVWKAVKDFWNTYIAPVFTATFWLDLAKKCANGLISGFEGGINAIISLFETMINWIVNGLNKISFDVPDWVPLIGGKTFGFNIPEVKFGRVSIPRLAQGTVVPPNREFMAVLGDNTKEHEIVSPISTMKQAFTEAMLEMNTTGQITKEEHYYLSETELMSIIYRLVRGGERISGGSLVGGTV